MFTLPDLPYSFEALEPYIDKETMQIHHDKHHAVYIQNLNDALKDYPDMADKEVNDLISNLEAIPETIRTKVRNHGGGHANHSFFWQLMTPQSKGPTLILSAIEKAFGNLDSFKEKFTAEAMARFGSGWAWLVASKGNLEIVTTANQDSPISEGKSPILALDVWEHAYYLKYQNKRVDYIKAWWNVVNWEKVDELFKKLA